ncbi:barrier-to-autointegration factor-like [Adelges cooleyi]|uniref:barrier-to-autointegration factor-like n=1 Tax=Adelges cooleyi TaxID=133065 RepID=UPI00217FA3A4|nr:barrier-to-autointegration factor-like [Adelges cooleyi]
MSTSQKHREYAGEPMREKDDDELAGIGPVLSSRLKQQGFTKLTRYILYYDSNIKHITYYWRLVCNIILFWNQFCVQCSKIIHSLSTQHSLVFSIREITLKAYKVLDQFLFLGKNQEMFSTWLKGTTKSNAKQAKVLCMP